MKNFDRELRKKVQSVECEIPRDLEDSIMDQLDRQQVEPIRFEAKHTNWIYGAIAAAVFVLVVLIFVFQYIQRPVQTVEADEVGVQSAFVEGKPATTIVIKQPDTDLTIVWIEKIDQNDLEINKGDLK